MARVKDDVDNVWGALGYVGMLAIECVIHTVSVLVCMVSISPVLTIIPVVIMPIVAYMAVVLEKSHPDPASYTHTGIVEGKFLDKLEYRPSTAYGKQSGQQPHKKLRLSVHDDIINKRPCYERIHHIQTDTAQHRSKSYQVQIPAPCDVLTQFHK